MLGWTLSALSALLALPVAMLCLEVAAALPRRAQRAVPATRRPRLAVLVPAHDEAAGIADPLAAIATQLVSGDRLVVVADNCTDDTAGAVRRLGLEVVERNDPGRRGKGYALDFGMRHLAADPPEVVVIMDADCRPAAGALGELARLCLEKNRPVQAAYHMHAPAAAGPGARLAEFAWILKGRVRPIGCQRLGLPCQLMGTGMALPWRLAGNARLATGNLVEDLSLGLEMAALGDAPCFAPGTKVESAFPDAPHAAATQRTRWEHGHLGMIVRVAPRMLLEAALRRNGPLAALVLDMCVPPLALLALLLSAALAANAVFALASGDPVPLWISAAAMLAFVAAVLAAWARYGRDAVPFALLLYAPWYAARKLPLYLAFLVKRQVEWVRTDRGPR